jgi:SprB-like repeat protein/type IX secretion system substrate protein
MRSLITIWLFGLVAIKAYSQNYEVVYSTEVVYIQSAFSVEEVRYKITSNGISTDLNGVGDLIISGRPTTIEVTSSTLDIENNGDIVSVCEQTQIITLPNQDCFGYLNASFSTTCSGFVSIQIDVTPILSFDGLTSSENDINNSIPFCISSPIRLVASPGFNSYNWQYKLEGQNWLSFNPGTGNDVSFSLEDVIGAQASSYLNKTALFRYYVGNCSVSNATAQKTYTFTIPPPIITSIATSPPACVGGSDGSVTMITLDRTLLTGESILYDLFNNSGVQVDQNDTGVFSNLSSGQYSVSIQGKNFSYCTTSSPVKSFQIIDPTQIDFTTSNEQPVICYGSSTGSISINASGGTGLGYTYSIDGGSFSGNSTLSNLSVGNHSVIVRDSNGCNGTKTISISGPTSPLSMYIDITSNYNGSPLSCFSSSDAAINIVASNGWGGYTYSASQNGTYVSSSTFSNLPAGTHTFWIRDLRGCAISKDIIISAPGNLVVDNTVLTLPQCIGDFGSIVVIASGGTGQIQYSIDNANFQLSSQFYAPAGVYNVYLKDENGCTGISPPITIIDPTPISYTTTIIPPGCNGTNDGAISILNVNNGVAPYQYSIDGGITYGSGSNFTNISAGAYDIVVKDTNGCLSTSSVVVSEPDKVTGVISETPILCNGESTGMLSVMPSGGSGTYSYLWLTGETTGLISGLAAGSYQVTITDQNGCISNSLSYSLIQPDEILVTPLKVVVNGYEITCSGASDGIVDLAVSGGSILSDYSYQWSNGQATSTLSNVVAGMYSVLVFDDNGCSAEAFVEVTEPPPLVINENIIANVACNGGNNGSVEVVATGGVGGYLFSLDAGSFASDNIFFNLISGSHSVRVKDLNGCEQISTISITEPEKIEIILESTNRTVCGQANGLIDISVTGGILPYQYNWQDEFGQVVGSAEDLLNYPSGAYSLIVTDANGCMQSLNAAISNSDGPVIEIKSLTATTCFDSSDGGAEITVNGGLPPYTINWDNGESGLAATNLIKGSIQVSVKDDTGCVAFMTLDIPGSDPIEIMDLQISNPLCFGDTDGSISVNAEGGTAPYSYTWSNGETGSVLNDLGAASYEVTIVDINNCTFSQTVSLDQPSELLVSAEVNVPSCIGNADGSIFLDVSGGVSPYNIYMNGNIVGTNFIGSLLAGTYTLIIRDANNCSIATDVVVADAEPWSIIMDDIIICEGQEVSLVAPVEADSFTWQYQSQIVGTESTLTVSQAGQYTLDVVSSSGCIGTGSFSVSISNEVLTADFLMSSKAYVGDTVIIIDITFPLPDSIAWAIPGSVEIIEMTQDLAIVVFDSAGIYDIGFDAFLGNCHDYSFATIEIVDPKDAPINGRITGDSSPLILSLDVYPNPNNGDFSIESIFREPQEAKVRLIHLLTNRLILEDVSQKSIQHTFNIDQPQLPSGAYAVVIETADEVRVVRMIKQ